MSYTEPGIVRETELPKDLLIAGPHPTITKEVDIPAGVLIEKGSVMGRITANGQYVLSLTAAADGSQAPAEVLLQEVAASGAARKGLIVRTGELAAHLLKYGTGHSRATVEEPLRARGIFLTDVIEN